MYRKGELRVAVHVADGVVDQRADAGDEHHPMLSGSARNDMSMRSVPTGIHS
jgi:hypothetical protein